MASLEDIQGYVERVENAGLASEEIDQGMWVLSTDGTGARIVVNYQPPVLVFRVNVMELPTDPAKRADLMEKLLRLNATDLLHGSYGIEDAQVVLTDALAIEDLDFSEFQSTIDSIQLALGSHLSALATYQE
jgi:CesT_Tir_1